MAERERQPWTRELHAIHVELIVVAAAISLLSSSAEKVERGKEREREKGSFYLRRNERNG